MHESMTSQKIKKLGAGGPSLVGGPKLLVGGMAPRPPRWLRACLPGGEGDTSSPHTYPPSWRLHFWRLRRLDPRRVDSRALSAPPCRPLFANRRFALAITRRWAWHNNTNTSVIYFIAFISRKVNYRRNEPLNQINFAASSDRVTSSKFLFQLCNGPFAVISHFVL